VPAAVWVEFLFGIDLGRLEQARQELLGRAQLHAFGPVEAMEAVHLQRELREAGRLLAWHDLQVAATARAVREPLVSNDKAFRGIPGLDVASF
jgi:predicted nucleic acid-binding protein